jgi:hypothetical protein
VRSLQAVVEGVVVGVVQRCVGLTFQGCELGCYVCEVSGYILCGVLVISWPGVHSVRVLTDGGFSKPF